MITPSMDPSSSLKRKRDHPSWSSGPDALNRSSSFDRNAHRSWKQAKSEFHGHACVESSMPILSRLDKARSFAKKDFISRNGFSSDRFVSEKNSDAHERGVLDKGDLQAGSPSAPRKLERGKFLKKIVDERQEPRAKNAEDDPWKGSSNLPVRGENLKRVRADVSTAVGHGAMNCDADRSLSKRKPLAHVDTVQQQSRIPTDKDGFKRTIKIKTKTSSGVEISDAHKDPKFSRARLKEEKTIASSSSKSHHGSSDELSWKSSSSAIACRVKKPSAELMSADRSVAEAPLRFLHVTRKARSERRRDESLKSRSSRGGSLDGFCAEIEEALLKKQEAEANLENQSAKKRIVDIATSTPLPNNNGDAVISADLSGTYKVASLEETDEREEGELEPEDEVIEKHSSEGGNEMENNEGLEMHAEKTREVCDDLVNNKGSKESFDCRRLLAGPSRHNIGLYGADFVMHEEKAGQDCDGLESQKSCKQEVGCLQLHIEPNGHNIPQSAADGCTVGLEAVMVDNVPLSDTAIDAEVKVGEHKNSIDRSSERVFDGGREYHGDLSDTAINSEVKMGEHKNNIDRTSERVFDGDREYPGDLPAMHLNSPKFDHSHQTSSAQPTPTSSHLRGDDLLRRDDPSFSVEPARQGLEILNKSPNIGEKRMRDSCMQGEGGDNRDFTRHVKDSEELSKYEHAKQTSLKVEPLQLSLGLPGCPSGSSESLRRPIDNEVLRTQDVRRAQSLSHLRADSMSNGFTASLSLSSFIHNPSCSLNCVSLENQELSCGGSRQSFQVKGAISDGELLGDVKKRVKNLSNTRTEQKPVSPLYQEGLQDGKVLGSGTGLPCYTKFASGLKNSPMQDGVHMLLNEASPYVLTSNPGRSKDVEVKTASNVTIGLLEISSEPIAAMAQKLQELPDSFLEGLKGLVKGLLGSFAKREEFLALQQIIRTRTDLTEATLLRAHPTQLEILVSLKTGIQNFVEQGAKSLTYKALIEIFLQTRCRNVDCQQLLPVDGCECKVCSDKKGFCHECMCMVCSKFDSDSNTSRWVGCDVCMHWCHTDCGIRMSHIKSTRVSRSGIEFLEMQFQCLSCDHYMELYGFVKGVFENFASTWGAETLAKELDCVRRIFHGSEDTRGKQLRWKAEEMLQMLERNASVQDVCSSMLCFFSGNSIQPSPVTSKTMESSQIADRTDGANKVNATMGSLVARKLSNLVEAKESEGREMEKKDGNSQDLHSNIEAKLTDVLVYQARADAAREDAINLKNIISLKAKKLEEDYSLKCAKLRLDAAEQQRRKHLEELQALEKSHHEYEIMKLRIETDMKHLMMKIMERPRPQLA